MRMNSLCVNSDGVNSQCFSGVVREIYQGKCEEQVAGGLGSLGCAAVGFNFCRQNQLEHLRTHTHFYSCGVLSACHGKCNLH